MMVAHSRALAPGKNRRNEEREREGKKILAGGKNKEERTPVGCDEHRANQAVSSSTEHIVLKLGARSRHCCNWMEECKEEGE